MITLDDRKRIREAYAKADLSPQHGLMVSPYSLGIDWMGMFSPIEDRVWDAIRYLGLPLYPQYPVGPFFVDFGDPNRRLAVEVDSNRWHKDKEKDARRDDVLRRLGWHVCRIHSSKCFTTREDYVDDDGMFNRGLWMTDSAEGILYKIYEDRPRVMGAFQMDAEKMTLVAIAELNNLLFPEDNDVSD